MNNSQPINPKNYQQLHARLVLKTVTIPATATHEGHYKRTVILKWECPICGGPRGELFEGLSYDGSRRMTVHCWKNPCGHVDTYDAVRAEAQTNPYNEAQS